MDKMDIGKTAAEAAVAAAQKALNDEPELSWVKKSSLFERAYLCGLYFDDPFDHQCSSGPFAGAAVGRRRGTSKG